MDNSWTALAERRHSEPQGWNQEGDALQLERRCDRCEWMWLIDKQILGEIEWFSNNPEDASSQQNRVYVTRMNKFVDQGQKKLKVVEEDMEQVTCR